MSWKYILLNSVMIGANAWTDSFSRAIDRKANASSSLVILLRNLDWMLVLNSWREMVSMEVMPLWSIYREKCR